MNLNYSKHYYDPFEKLDHKWQQAIATGNLTISQVAKLSGFSRQHIYNLISKGKITTKMLDVAWEFIESRNNKSNWSIVLPLEQCHDTRINKWSNRFVHSGNFTPTYIQVYLHKLLSHLMTPPTSPVTIYNGRKKRCCLLGDIRINNYNDLKSDFQNYIDAKMGGRGRATIYWESLDDVHAYIISL